MIVLRDDVIVVTGGEVTTEELSGEFSVSMNERFGGWRCEFTGERVKG